MVHVLASHASFRGCKSSRPFGFPGSSSVLATTPGMLCCRDIERLQAWLVDEVTDRSEDEKYHMISWKTTMSPENQWLEDVLSIEIVFFLGGGDMLIFSGCNAYSNS